MEDGNRRTEAGGRMLECESFFSPPISQLTLVKTSVTVSEPYYRNVKNILPHKAVTHFVTACHCVSVKVSECVTDIVNTSKPCGISVYNYFIW